MDKKYRVHPILPYLYHIEEVSLGVFCSLVVGTRRALLLDTGFGTGDLRGVVEWLTDRPFDVVLSHCHHDHSGGAWQFGEAWIHPRDRAHCQAVNGPDRRGEIWGRNALLQRRVPKDVFAPRGCCALRALEEGQLFHLGGITAEVWPMPGHTPGSVGLLLPERRLLLTGDAAGPAAWLFLDEALPLPAHVRMLEQTKQLPFDQFLTSHRETLFPKGQMDALIQVAREATVQNSVPDAVGTRFGVEVLRHEIGAPGSEQFASVLFCRQKLAGEQ